MTETDGLIVEVNSSGVIQVQGAIDDAAFLSRIRPAIERFDSAIRYACEDENDLATRITVAGIPHNTLATVAGVSETETADYLQGSPVPEPVCSRLEIAAADIADLFRFVRERFGMIPDVTDAEGLRAAVEELRAMKSRANAQAQMAQAEKEVADALKEMANLS
jgi:hypothetical protein